MIVDSHQHFWNPARGDYGWMDGPGLEAIRKPILPENLAAHLNTCGIDLSLIHI